MMPKEKAKELISKFKFLTYPESNSKFYNPEQCALIAVDVILNDVGAKDWSGDIACEGRNYWQEVKQEIENF